MGKSRAAKRFLAVTAAAAAIAAMGAAPAQASTMWVPCDSNLIEPLCDAADRQIDHAVAEATAAVNYVFLVGDTAIREVNDTYTTVKCTVQPCP